MATRQEALHALDTEQEYAVRKWGENATDHDIAAWITYMQHYLDEARRIASTSSTETDALDSIRKVGNLAVACMMEHGAPLRE